MGGFTLRHVLLALLPLSLTGCASVREDGDGATYAAVRSRSTAGLAAAAARRAPAPKDQYLAFQARRRASNSFQFGLLSCDLWAPFRVETSGGLYDPRKATVTNEAIFCMELDGRATDPLQFYGICAQVINGGLNTYAYLHTSGSPIGSQFFANATEADFAIETDGNTMNFLARPTGDPSWTLLAQAPFQNQTVPLLPALGVSRMNSGAHVGFDNTQVVSNGNAPTALRVEQQLSREICDAVHPQVRALHLVDGANPDFAAASTQLSQARVLLEAAIDTAEQMELGSAILKRRVLRNLNRGKASLNKAAALATRGRGAPAVVNTLKPGIVKQLDAAGAVYPPTAPP